MFQRNSEPLGIEAGNSFYRQALECVDYKSRKVFVYKLTIDIKAKYSPSTRIYYLLIYKAFPVSIIASASIYFLTPGRKADLV